MNLNEYFEEYKALTLSLIDEVKADNELDYLIEKRQNILNSINELNFDKEELKSIVSSLKIFELDKELQNLIKKEKIKVKIQIENLKKTSQAHQQYNRIDNVARVFNKSI